MTKTRRDKRAKKKWEPHVRLYKSMLECPAWKSLSTDARCLWIVLSSYCRGENNGELFLGVRDAARALNVSVNTVRKAFEQLRDRGFIRVAVPSSFHRKNRKATCYEITDHDLGERKATREFLKWSPPPTQTQEPVPNFDTEGINP